MNSPNGSIKSMGAGALPLSPLQSVSYVAPTVVVAFSLGSLGLMQGIYAKYFGVSLATISMVLLISRIFDAVTDPLIGYFSDSYQKKFGTRKPFILCGGLLFIVSGYFLYVPVDPDSVDGYTVVSTPYFLFWFLLFYLTWTVLEIPHLAWASELSPSSNAKNKIYSLRYLANFCGSLCFYAIPFLPFFATSEFTPKTLQWAVTVAGVLMLPALYFCIEHTPNGPHISFPSCQKTTLWSLRNELLSNKPFLLFISAFSLFNVGTGFWFTLIFIVADSYLGLGHRYALMVLVALMISMPALGAWYWMANRLGKKVVLGLSGFLYAMSALLTGFLVPGEESSVGLFLAILFAYMSAIPAIAPSLLADIIDFSRWHYRADHSATYFSIFTFASKTTAAIGGAIGLGVAGFYGFSPSATVHSDEAVFGLHLAVSWLPAFFIMLSIVVVGLIPMNARRHRIVRRRLDSISAKSKVVY